MKYEFKCVECNSSIKVDKIDISKILQCQNCTKEYNVNEIIHLSNGGDKNDILKGKSMIAARTWNVHIIFGGFCILISGFCLLSTTISIYFWGLINNELIKYVQMIAYIFLTLGGLFLTSIFDWSREN